MVEHILEKQELYRGDTYSRSLPFFEVIEGVETSIDLAATFQEVRLHLRRGGRESGLILSRSLTEGTMSIQEGNVLVWEFSEAETAALLGGYKYDLQMTYNDGSVETWLQGELLVHNDTTV